MEFSEHGTHYSCHRPIVGSDCAFYPRNLDRAVFQGVLRAADRVLCFLFHGAHYAGMLYDMDSQEIVGILEFVSDGGKMIFTQSAVSSDRQFVALLGQTNYDVWIRQGDRTAPRSFSIYILQATNCDVVHDRRKDARTGLASGSRKVFRLDRVCQTHADIQSANYQGVRFAFLPAAIAKFYFIFNTKDWPTLGTTGHVTKVDLRQQRVVKSAAGSDFFGLGVQVRIQNIAFAQEGAVMIVSLESVDAHWNKLCAHVVMSSESMQVLARLTNELALDFRNDGVNGLHCFVNVMPSVSQNGRRLAVVSTTSATVPCLRNPGGHACRNGCDAGTNDSKRVIVYDVPLMLLSLQSCCKRVIRNATANDRWRIACLPLPNVMRDYLAVRT